MLVAFIQLLLILKFDFAPTFLEMYTNLQEFKVSFPNSNIII